MKKALIAKEYKPSAQNGAEVGFLIPIKTKTNSGLTQQISKRVCKPNDLNNRKIGRAAQNSEQAEWEASKNDFYL